MTKPRPNALDLLSQRTKSPESELVAPPYHPPFRPYKPPVIHIRADAEPLREGSPKTGSAGFYPQHRD